MFLKFQLKDPNKAFLVPNCKFFFFFHKYLYFQSLNNADCKHDNSLLKLHLKQIENFEKFDCANFKYETSFSNQNLDTQIRHF